MSMMAKMWLIQIDHLPELGHVKIRGGMCILKCPLGPAIYKCGRSFQDPKGHSS